MARLAVVSNRVPNPDGQANAGGLVTALQPALEAQHGGTWLGWSGTTCTAPGAQARVSRGGGFRLATIDLTEAELDGYYNHFANRVLWPAFHCRLDLVTTDQAAAYATYRTVNRRFAAALLPLRAAGDMVWVQDYHLIPLGEELRRRGVTAPIGFFLHIPFPPPETFAALPSSRELARALAAYDLVGFQRRSCVENFLAYVRDSGLGTTRNDGSVFIGGRTARVEVHPIGIDTRGFAELAASPAVTARAQRIRASFAGQSIIAGVERLDYTKGIAQRFHALEALLERHPEYLGRVALCQVAAPSRLALPEYRAVQAELERLSGRINGRFGDFGWSPIRYINRAFGQRDVAALLRASRVGLVTPLRDGMNLVAKEYLAAQDPADPGVLVLSRFAGAADQLPEALIVDPSRPASLAEALRRALEMPPPERRRRWESMMSTLQTNDVHRWQRGFRAALALAAGRAEKRSLTAA